MLIGYMRVSTAEQSLGLQRDALTLAGCERIHEDVCSGAVADRPGLGRALEVLRAGDALVVWRLDRIGRALAHLVAVGGARGGRSYGLKEQTGGINTTPLTGRLVFGLFATLAEFERDLIHERTMAGLAAARDVAAELGISLSTLYAYVDGKGGPKERARRLLGR